MIKKLIFAAVLFFPGIAAHAGSFTGCAVVTIVSAGDQNIHVNLNCPNPATDLPACATASTYVGFDGNSPAGKHYFALMSLALALNLKLDGTIDSACSPYQGNVALLTSLRASK